MCPQFIRPCLGGRQVCMVCCAVDSTAKIMMETIFPEPQARARFVTGAQSYVSFAIDAQTIYFERIVEARC